MELCLRIRTYALIEGGWDRALARRAFAPDLPTEIVRRRAKGGVTVHLRNILRRNAPFIREMLLDGVLVREGLLDKQRLELCLSAQGGLKDAAFAEVAVDHISTEAWLRSWSEQRQLAAA
jgi:asparagine synthase (glutamine-hydrolysing)